MERHQSFLRKGSPQSHILSRKGPSSQSCPVHGSQRGGLWKTGTRDLSRAALNEHLLRARAPRGKPPGGPPSGLFHLPRGPSPAATSTPNWPHLQMGPDRLPLFPPQQACSLPQILLGMWGLLDSWAADLGLSVTPPPPQGRLPYFGTSFPGSEISTFSPPKPLASLWPLWGPPVWVSEREADSVGYAPVILSEGLMQGLHLFIFPHRGQTSPHEAVSMN